MLGDGMRYASTTKARMARKIATSATSDLNDSHALPDAGGLPRACATEPFGLEDEEERLREATVKGDSRCEMRESSGRAMRDAGKFGDPVREVRMRPSTAGH